MSESRIIDEDARRRFESGWIEGRPLPLADCLPPGDSPAFLGTLEELVCIDLEMFAVHRPAERPRVEDYLARFPQLDQPEIVRRLLTQEIEVRKRAGEAVDPGEYERRFSASLMPTIRRASDDTRGPAPASEPGVQRLLSPPQASDELGRLGPYRVLSVLGKGGMGQVFHAEDIQLRRQVALKVMLPQFADDPRSRTRFQREAQAAAALEHEHIVTIYQVGEDRGIPFVAMPLLRGESLHDRLRREPRLSVDEAIRIGREIAEGLAAAHEHGLIHRDIKPANVFLVTGQKPNRSSAGSTPDQRIAPKVKILDFGLARPVTRTPEDEPLTETGETLGTPAYMAPEQARGEPTDARSDLFSLGCVLYQMTTSDIPFKGASAFAVMTAISSEQPTAPAVRNPDLPAPLNELILRLLAKRPADRPASAGEVAAELFELGAGMRPESHASSATAASTTRQIAGHAEPSRVFRASYLAGAGALVVAIALVVAARNGWFVGTGAPPAKGPADDGAQPVAAVSEATGSLMFKWTFQKGMPPGIEKNRTEVVDGKKWNLAGGTHLRFVDPGVSSLTAAFDLSEDDLAAIRGKRGQWRLHVLHAEAPSGETPSPTKNRTSVRIRFNDRPVWEGSPTGPRTTIVPGGQPWMRFDCDVSPWLKQGKNVLHWDYLSGPDYWLYSFRIRWETDGRDAESPVTAESERRLALWVLRAGASVKVSVDGAVRKFDAPAELPAADFRIDSVALAGEVFGHPIGEPEDCDGDAKCLRFDGGIIIMPPDATAGRVLRGLIYDAYRTHDHARAPLGRPLSNVQGGSGGAVYVPFERGEIILPPNSKTAFTCAGPIYESYKKTPNHPTVFGHPISAEYDFAGGRRQDFERRSIVWTAKDGARVVNKS